MDQRISLVTLGVADIARSAKFYQDLGWRRSGPEENVAFFQANGLILGLYGRDALAEEANQDSPGGGFDGMALAQNMRSKAEVDAVLAEAVTAGARLLKPAADTFWGGYSGYFADPDGHVWEIAWNPFWTLDEAGNVHLPD